MSKEILEMSDRVTRMILEDLGQLDVMLRLEVQYRYSPLQKCALGEKLLYSDRECLYQDILNKVGKDRGVGMYLKSGGAV